MRADGGFDLGAAASGVVGDLERPDASELAVLARLGVPPLLLEPGVAEYARVVVDVADLEASALFGGVVTRARGWAADLRDRGRLIGWPSGDDLGDVVREVVGVPAVPLELDEGFVEDAAYVLVAAALLSPSGVSDPMLGTVTEQIHLMTPFVTAPDLPEIPLIPERIEIDDILAGALAVGQIQDIIAAIVEVINELKLVAQLPADAAEPLNACAGTSLRIVNQDGWPTTGLGAVTAPLLVGTAEDGTVIRRGLPAEQLDDVTLEVDLPDNVVSGEIVIEFRPTVNAPAMTFGLFDIPASTTQHRYRLPFLGGSTQVTAIVLGEPARRFPAWIAGDDVELLVLCSNTTAVRWTAELDGQVIGEGLEDDVAMPDGAWFQYPRGDERTPYGASVTIPLPGGLASCADLSVSVEVEGACGPATHTFEIPVERTPRLLDVDTVAPMQRNFVEGYYLTRGAGRDVDVFLPRTIDELAGAIRTVESQNGRVGPKSTGCSYHDLTVPTVPRAFVIEGDALLERFWPGAPYDADDYEARIGNQADAIRADRESLAPLLREDLTSVLSTEAIAEYQAKTRIGDAGMPAVADRLVYIDATTKIGDLERALFKLDLTIFTRGAAGHQSLAGAISTGTHGATLHLPPTSDMVRAIHLVGPGGTIWWVEPTGSRAITVEEFDGRPMPELNILDGQQACTRVWRSTDAFRSLLVSMGVGGVIVGYVIETVPTHTLIRNVRTEDDQGNELDWPTCRQMLSTEVLAARGPSSNNWFYAPTVASSGKVWLDTIQLSSADPLPAPQGGMVVGGGGDADVLIGLATTVGGGAASGVLAELLREEIESLAIESALLGIFVLATDIERRIEAIGDLLKAMGSVAALATTAGQHPKVIADALSDVLNALWRSSPWVPGIKEALRGLLDELHSKVAGGQLDLDRESPRWSHQVLGGSNPGRRDRDREGFQAAIRWFAISHEYAMPAPKVPLFVDDLMELADRQRRSGEPCMFQMNLRFTQGSMGFAAQQQHRLTGHVEVFSFPALGGSDALYAALRAAAETHDAIPHWGQRQEQRVDLDLLPDIDIWRDTIRALGEGYGEDLLQTFGTSFVRNNTGLW